MKFSLQVFICLFIVNIMFIIDIRSQPVLNQVINNIGDPNDVWLIVYADTNIISYVSYREATIAFVVNEGDYLKIRISASLLDTLSIPMMPSQTGFIWIYNGVRNSSGFYNPYNRDIRYELANNNMADATIKPGKVPITIINGVTDAPVLKFVEVATIDQPIWAAGVDYKQWVSNYLYKEPKEYMLEVKDSFKDTVIDTYIVDLTDYANTPLCLFTSGFLFPEKNKGGKEFGLFAVGTDGKVIQFPSINPKPEHPMLIRPSDKAIDRHKVDTLWWYKAKDATQYRLLVSKDSNFVSTFTDKFITDTVYIHNGFDYDTKYFWKVQSKNDVNGRISSWSETRSFETVYLPDKVILNNPPDKSTKIPLTETLHWQKKQNMISFHLIFWEDNHFSNPLIDTSDLTAYWFQVTGLKYETKYYWQVQASNEAGTGELSEVWEFTTEREVFMPKQTILLYPHDGKKSFKITDTLWWSSQPDILYYHIEISKENNFEKPDFQYGIWDTFYYNDEFKYQTLYYWRVQCENKVGYGEWSEVRSFETEEFVDVEEWGNNEQSIMLYPNPVETILSISGTISDNSRRIKIISVEGIVLTECDYKIKLDVSELPPGFYYLKYGNIIRGFLKI